MASWPSARRARFQLGPTASRQHLGHLGPGAVQRFGLLGRQAGEHLLVSGLDVLQLLLARGQLGPKLLRLPFCPRPGGDCLGQVVLVASSRASESSAVWEEARAPSSEACSCACAARAARSEAPALGRGRRQLSLQGLDASQAALAASVASPAAASAAERAWPSRAARSSTSATWRAASARAPPHRLGVQLRGRPRRRWPPPPWPPPRRGPPGGRGAAPRPEGKTASFLSVLPALCSLSTRQVETSR